jgi:hypothetical protein
MTAATPARLRSVSALKKTLNSTALTHENKPKECDLSSRLNPTSGLVTALADAGVNDGTGDRIAVHRADRLHRMFADFQEPLTGCGIRGGLDIGSGSDSVQAE